ncbi:conserved exported protein of unknown function [Nitrospira sp. KM1]|uniref:phospholipase D-like domain-containing protein n=1 Tax=Nitrospira sp. KM1 TaxID=1936990 RepID=UPI0013A78D78|nr:phospholipase D-like domain-containing protein [Nitrospira sp. KM1]BCA53290.1 conserved exported protein of unknown function [Nitrospira sp. KM1]
MVGRRPPIIRTLGLILALALPLQTSPVWGISIEVYYAPEDHPLDRVIELYGRARQYIHVAVYGLTYPPAVQALVTAKKRGIDVRMITDQERSEEPKQRSALRTLRLAGIPIRVNRHDGLMHLKQVVIDDDVTANGSMNHTTSGNRYNDERLDVVTDRRTAVKAREKFLAMWNDTARYRPWIED